MKKNSIVYSCSGASSAAQMANAIAVKLDRKKVVPMGCIAGVGGHVSSLVAKAHTADCIIAIDGCPLRCVEQCLKQHGLKSAIHYDLSSMGVQKRMHEDFNAEKAEEIFEKIKKFILSQPL